MNAMLMIGNDKTTVKAAADACIALVKACDSDAKAVAAFGALQELARSPQHTSVTDCHFTSNPPRKRR